MMMVAVAFANPGSCHPRRALSPEFLENPGHGVGLRGEHVDAIRRKTGQGAATNPFANNHVDPVGQQGVNRQAVPVISFAAPGPPAQESRLHALGIDQQVKRRPAKMLAQFRGRPVFFAYRNAKCHLLWAYAREGAFPCQPKTARMTEMKRHLPAYT